MNMRDFAFSFSKVPFDFNFLFLNDLNHKDKLCYYENFEEMVVILEKQP